VRQHTTLNIDHHHTYTQGKTQYETYRWMDLHRRLLAEKMFRLADAEEAEEAADAAAGADGVRSSRSSSRPGGSGWMSRALSCVPFFGGPRDVKVALPANAYARGFYANLHEVVFWERHLQAAADAVAAARSARGGGARADVARAPVGEEARAATGDAAASASTAVRRRGKGKA
jgi:hypothetical protein